MILCFRQNLQTHKIDDRSSIKFLSLQAQLEIQAFLIRVLDL